jgi:protein-S-isoprenylcysteine O-methyltransferase Ste14
VTVAQLQGWTVLAVLAAWFSSAAIFVFRRRPPESPERARDPLGLIGLALQGVGVAIVWTVRRTPGTPLVEAPFSALVFLSALTVALAVCSVSLTHWAVRTLGRQWSLDARLVEGHELVTRGPYRYVRNPIYSGMLGMLIAAALAVSRPVGAVAAVIVFCAGSVVRIRAEERLLRTAFGETWEAWARRTPAFVPGLW